MLYILYINKYRCNNYNSTDKRIKNTNNITDDLNKFGHNKFSHWVIYLFI